MKKPSSPQPRVPRPSRRHRRGQPETRRAVMSPHSEIHPTDSRLSPSKVLPLPFYDLICAQGG